MKVNFLVLLALIIFITGCTIRTTGNVVIEEGVDESGNVIIEEVTEEPAETGEAEEPLEGEVPEEEVEEAEESETAAAEEAEEKKETTATPGITGTVINIENLEFKPETLTIKKGETVTWVHKDKYLDNMKHMVRIYPGGDASPIMFYDDFFSHTFDEEGEYTIIDVIYTKKNVKGKIIVE